MQTIDRWRRWHPAEKIIGEPPEQAPPKPSKATSGGFEGGISGTPQIISEQARRVAPAALPVNEDAPDPDTDDQIALWQMFTAWFDSRVRLDARAIALGTPPAWVTAVAALYRDHVRWTLDRNLTPHDCAGFRHLLSVLGCAIQTIHDEFAMHVGLKDDVQGQQQFQSPPAAPAPAKPYFASHGESNNHQQPVKEKNAMTMTFKATVSTRDSKDVPPGTYPAICVLIADLGMQPGTDAYPEPKQQLFIQFELPSAPRVQYWEKRERDRPNDHWQIFQCINAPKKRVTQICRILARSELQ